MADVLIFGAGKIARGFLGQLLFDAGMKFAFVEANSTLVEMLRSRGGYKVNVLGAPDKSEWIDGFEVLSTGDAEGIESAMKGAQLIFTAVGGKNLPSIAPVLARALGGANAPAALNVVTCENWKQPAALLEKEVRAIEPGVRAGFAEAVVMRSAIEPDPEELARDPLLVNVQDFWQLPIDADALIAPLPPVAGLKPVHGFCGFLERKFYTYNAANGTVSYLGALLGHRRIADAAWDERVQEVLEQVYLETGRALASRHGIGLEEQMAFADTSRRKLRDRVLVDNIERNARDPLRKLGPDDRLVGSARLAMEHGVTPGGLATAIAAAIHYQNQDDPSAQALQAMRERGGAALVLEEVCGLPKGNPLHELVLRKEMELEAKGWIG